MYIDIYTLSFLRKEIWVDLTWRTYNTHIQNYKYTVISFHLFFKIWNFLVKSDYCWCCCRTGFWRYFKNQKPQIGIDLGIKACDIANFFFKFFVAQKQKQYCNCWDLKNLGRCCYCLFDLVMCRILFGQNKNLSYVLCGTTVVYSFHCCRTFKITSVFLFFFFWRNKITSFTHEVKS